MKRFAAVALLAAGTVSSVPAQAADLCETLRVAWKAGRADPQTMREMRLEGAERCSFSNGDLRCSWPAETDAQARRLYEETVRSASACLSRFGASPKAATVKGVETTTLHAADSTDPDVAIFLTRAGVTVTIVTVE